MTLHAFLQYLRYSWKAMGRHGTHSPFVYELIEQVLLNKELIDKRYIVNYPSLPLKYENLLSRIAEYYGYNDILRLPPEGEVKSKADMLILGAINPLQWAGLMNEYAHLLKNDSAVIAVNIHQSQLHTKGWLQLCADTKVRMSIDLYGIGVLFFRREFKEKQHFVLKY